MAVAVNTVLMPKTLEATVTVCCPTVPVPSVHAKLASPCASVEVRAGLQVPVGPEERGPRRGRGGRRP